MPTAKDFFLSRLSTFESTLSFPNLQSVALTDREHNEKARLLRNGLAIIEFNILEDYIKKRIGEAFKFIGNSTVSFNQLPESIKEASVFNALKGVLERAENLKRASEDYLSFVQAETKFISSTTDIAYELSEYSLGWDKSNLQTDDPPNFLKIFNVKGGWNAIAGISSMLNISIIQPQDIFRNAAQRRHKAAHNPNADSPLTDLESFVLQSKIIALSFDVLISKSLKYIKDNNSNFLSNNMKVEINQIHFRFLKKVDSVWKEYIGNSKRAYRTNVNFDVLFNDAKARATAHNEILVIKPTENSIKDWIVTEI